MIMATKLEIAPNLVLPIDAVTQTIAIMSKRGTGKTHTASVMAEEMLKHGQTVVVYDPTSAWWGLKSSASGKRRGFPIVIFGGEHADVPLEENAGELIANVIVDKRISAILDCGLLRKGARIRFMTAFCEALYHRNREPLHLFVDEAQTVAPQNLKAMPEIARLVGALEDIILQGRRRGLGVTVISPRPAILNTSIRSACEVLIAMQIVGPHDRKAIQEWIDVHGDDAEKAKEMMASLSSLKRGEAWVWSPAWLELFVRTKFRARQTFDSSATPTVGSRPRAPSKMAEIDIAKLGADISAAAEKAKADDPRILRARIAELERAQPREKSIKVEVPILSKPAYAFIRDHAGQMQKALAKIKAIHEAWGHNLSLIDKRIADLIAVLERAANTKPAESSMALATRIVQPGAPSGSEPKPKASGSGGGNGAAPRLGAGEIKILTAIAQHSEGVSQEQITVLTGYKRSSRNTYMQRLAQHRLIARRGDVFHATDLGIQTLGPEFLPLPTGAELRAYWLRELPEGEKRLLAELIKHYPAGLDQDMLSAATAYKRSSRNTYLQRLRSRQLIVSEGGGMLRASDKLF
jgi:hypothetical protein